MPNQNSHSGKIPQRTCVVCRAKRDFGSLLSFILIPEGVIFDPARKIQTRRSYVCPQAECLLGFDKWKKANLKKRFGIANSAPVFGRVEMSATEAREK